jgi:hypothetical protein
VFHIKTGTAGAREASSHNEHENSSNNNALAGVSYKKTAKAAHR